MTRFLSTRLKRFVPRPLRKKRFWVGVLLVGIMATSFTTKRPKQHFLPEQPKIARQTAVEQPRVVFASSFEPIEINYSNSYTTNIKSQIRLPDDVTIRVGSLNRDEQGEYLEVDGIKARELNEFGLKSGRITIDGTEYEVRFKAFNFGEEVDVYLTKIPLVI